MAMDRSEPALVTWLSKETSLEMPSGNGHMSLISI